VPLLKSEIEIPIPIAIHVHALIFYDLIQTTAVSLFLYHLPGLLIAVAPLLLAQSSGDSSAATFFSCFLALFATATFKKEN